jgi:hypothetical protein
MKPASAKPNIIRAVPLAGVPPALPALVAHLVFGEAERVQEPLHECLELTGSCIALAVAMLLLPRLRHENASPHLHWFRGGGPVQFREGLP